MHVKYFSSFEISAKNESFSYILMHVENIDSIFHFSYFILSKTHKKLLLKSIHNMYYILKKEMKYFP